MAARNFNLTTYVDHVGARLYVAAWRLARAIESFRDDRSGATAIEYGLLAAGISVVIIATVFALGGVLENSFQTVLDKISSAPGG